MSLRTDLRNKVSSAVINDEQTQNIQQGDIMMKPYLTVVLTLTSLLGLGMSARAQDTDGVRVKVPFQFVSGGTTLSAGTYTIGPVSHAASRILSIRGYNKSALFLPIVFDRFATGQTKLDFEYLGDKYFLRGVETPAGVYTIALPRAMVALAQTKDRGTGSSSGAN
jgi:hypothetical protein